ncbi:thioredoxin reductase, partial [Streptomyces rubiginosohelvolus]
DGPGVWVAGNVTDLSAQVGAAAAAGATAAAHINADLIAEETRQAVAAARARDEVAFSAEEESRVCEAVLGDRRHGL